MVVFTLPKSEKMPAAHCTAKLGVQTTDQLVISKEGGEVMTCGPGRKGQE